MLMAWKCGDGIQEDCSQKYPSDVSWRNADSVPGPGNGDHCSTDKWQTRMTLSWHCEIGTGMTESSWKPASSGESNPRNYTPRSWRSPGRLEGTARWQPHVKRTWAGRENLSLAACMCSGRAQRICSVKRREGGFGEDKGGFCFTLFVAAVACI